MAEVYSLAKVRRREQAPPFVMPESWMIVARTFGFDTPRAFSAYYLHRSRYGTTVYVIGGRLTMNLSHYAQTYPPNFKEARKWIAAIAERQNWTMTETTRRATIFRDQPASTADQ